MSRNEDFHFSQRARRFWQQRQRHAAQAGYSGYLLDESPESLGRHRFEGEWSQLSAWLAVHGTGRERCLDLGCGTGLWLQALAGEFGQVEGWDYAPAMAQAARRRLKAAGIANAKVQAGDIGRRPGKAAFDLIFVGGVVMYTPDAQLQPLLKALKRLLKPGGTLVLRETTLQGATWRREGLPLRPGLLAGAAPKLDYVAVYRSHASLLAQLAKAGFAVQEQRLNRHYKLSDLTEDWLRRLNALSLGFLRRHPAALNTAAELLYRLRHLLLYPEYFLRHWRLQNRWFFCIHAPRTSSTLNER